ncbi:uncharacterized protein LOC130998458 [Salvia miltiorrhiza]|uniref:uncharacterized protein LOC130998458 n=1 Tax=Salvia miltiorrhiza TaxID=226208 RepID=UPI0025AD798D|nr:uncharacterized protein LOC130998458 [Salvia miltiorrhiza]
MECFIENVCRNWWAPNNFELAVRNSVGRSGGILSLWNKTNFAVSSNWDIPGAVIVNGIWLPGSVPCCFVNVYAPCDSSEKANLWEVIQAIAEQNNDRCLCVLEDFNAIREEGDRVGRDSSFVFADARNFDFFYPTKTVSDHCSIVLTTKTVDWGPKPFRFLNAWTTHSEFDVVVRKTWLETKIDGWSCFVFKDKLKKVKLSLKEWNLNVFGNIESRIKSLKAELQELDTIDDTLGLEEEEIIKRNEIRANIFLQSKNRLSLLKQKAKFKWLKEGDMNSSFYHKVIIGRRKKNEVAGLLIDNHWTDDPIVIKDHVRKYFEHLFKNFKRTLPHLPSDFVTRTLSTESRLRLVEPFTEAEIKDAIWSCDGDKSLGPDGFNLNFWKKSWEVIKADFLQVMEEFYTNGKIPQGCNS